VAAGLRPGTEHLLGEERHLALHKIHGLEEEVEGGILRNSVSAENIQDKVSSSGITIEL
jgi:hypothetical protein